MSVLLTLSAGGIMLFTLYGSQREMQKAADQAALAGAAALPPINPGVITDNVPLPGLAAVYTITGTTGLDIPRLDDIVPDPRAVACAYGANSLTADSARLVSAFGTPPASSPGGWTCEDNRIHPLLQSTQLAECVDGLVGGLTTRVTQLLDPISGLGGCILFICLPSLNDILAQVLAPINGLVDDLNLLAPAVLTPTMTVEVTSGVKPPLMSLVTGDDGIQMTVSATAQRTLKNAVVVPTTPGVPLTNINITAALQEVQEPLVNTLGLVDDQLNTLFDTLIPGAGCQDVLSEVQNDIADIYNPPGGGPNPTGRDLIDEAIGASQTITSRGGPALADAAGEAFFVIGAGPNPAILGDLVGTPGPLAGIVATALQPLLGSTQIPTLDVAIVAAHNLADGQLNTGDLIEDAVNARGLFQATLVN